jgi:hypothetical protein
MPAPSGADAKDYSPATTLAQASAITSLATSLTSRAPVPDPARAGRRAQAGTLIPPEPTRH